jgi:hypothetical protein
LIEEITKLFYEDEIFLAHEKLLLLDKLVANSALRNKEGKVVNLSDGDYVKWRESDLYNEILADIKTLNMALKTVQEFDQKDAKSLGWHNVKTSNDKKSWYRPVEGSNSIDVACECIVKAPIFYPIALFAEVNLYSSWIPRLGYCHIEKDYSRFRKTVHCEIQIPWPFNDRDGVFHGYGTALPDMKSVIVVIRSLDTEKKKEHLDCTLPEPRKNSNVRVTLEYGCMFFRYIDENTCLFRAIFNADPHMTYIPQWLINFGLKTVVYMILEKVKKKSEKFEGTELEDKVKENKYLYDEIRRRLHATLNDKDKEEKESLTITKDIQLQFQ